VYVYLINNCRFSCGPHILTLYLVPCRGPRNLTKLVRTVDILVRVFLLPSMCETPPRSIHARRAYLKRLVRTADEDDDGEGDVYMSPDKSNLVHLLRVVSLDLKECEGMEVSAVRYVCVAVSVYVYLVRHTRCVA
jgi:hypothetical protein